MALEQLEPCEVEIVDRLVEQDDIGILGEDRLQRRARGFAPVTALLEPLLRQVTTAVEGGSRLASYPRSHARPAASTTSSRGATSCMFPIARAAQPVKFTQRRNELSGSRIPSSSASSGGRSIA